MAFDKISFIRDQLANPFETIKNNRLELDIENLDNLISVKEKLLKYYNEYHEEVKIELETETDVENSFPETVKEDMEKLREKSKVLRGYLEHFSDYDFPLNQIRAENDMYIDDFMSKITVYVNKSKLIPDELDKLRELQKTCDELREKTNSLMAPAN